MLNIAKRQLIEGLRDSKFLFLFVLVMLACVINGFVYSQRYGEAMADWRESIRTTTDMLEQNSGSLQDISQNRQQMVKPPSALAFLADGGEQLLPNAWTVNAFVYTSPAKVSRGNRMLPILAAVDWNFIVGTLFTLLAILLGFTAVCGEKRDGTLRLILSFPVSRMKLFMGKFIGLMAVLAGTFLLGAVACLAILRLNGALPLTEEVILAIGWAAILSVLTISLVLLLSLAVSSMVGRPAVALVVLMVLWVVMVVAMPGIARLSAEMTVPVKSNFEVMREIEASDEYIIKITPAEAGIWNGDPFRETVPLRAERCKMIVAARQKIQDAAWRGKIRQAEMITLLSSIFPAGLLKSSLQQLGETGVAGYKTLMENARRYNQQLHSFTVEFDSKDPGTPHLVYSWGFSSDTGVFSQKPVAVSSFPRYHVLWGEGGLPMTKEWPTWALIALLVLNMAMAAVAFIALARYDPR